MSLTIQFHGQGCIAFVLSVLVCVYALNVVCFEKKMQQVRVTNLEFKLTLMFSFVSVTKGWIGITLSTTLCSLVEAYSKQVDNLTLPLYYLGMLLLFS